MRLAHHQPHWFTSLQRLAGWHQRSPAYIPRWRHPLVGYPVGLLLVGLSLAIGLVEARLLFPFSFPGLLLLFVVVLVALCWGVGAALFTTALSVLALDYLYVPTFGNLGSYSERWYQANSGRLIPTASLFHPPGSQHDNTWPTSFGVVSERHRSPERQPPTVFSDAGARGCKQRGTHCHSVEKHTS